MRVKNTVFTKMQSLGNDFVLIDARHQPFQWDAERIRYWADRHRGIGFDQLLVLELSDKPECDFAYRIFNADGSEVGQCGNGARCVGRFIQLKGLSSKQEWMLSTLTSSISVSLLPNQQFKVAMGIPRILPTVEGAWAALDLGNPHLVFRVKEVDALDLAQEAQPYLQDPAFPQGVNVGFVQLIDEAHLRLRVYERGVGPTLACGSGACAAVVAGCLQGLLGPEVEVQQPGGLSWVSWQGLGQPVYLTGPAECVFEGELYV